MLFFCFFEVTIHSLPHLKFIRLVSVRLSLPYVNIGVRIDSSIPSVGLRNV